MPAFVLVSWGRCSSSTGDFAAWAARLNFWTSFLEPLSDSSSQRLRVSLGGFGCFHSSGRSCLTVDTYSSSACWRLWKTFIFSLCGLADSDSEVCLSLFVAMLVVYGSGMYSTGYAGFGAVCAMFLKMPAELAVLVVNNGSGMHSAGFAGLHAPRAMFLTFAGRSGCSMSTLAVACCSWFCWYFRTSRCVPDDCRQVCQCARCCARLGLCRDENCGGPADAARLECPVPRQGC